MAEVFTLLIISPEGYEEWHPHNLPSYDNQPPPSTPGQLPGT